MLEVEKQEICQVLTGDSFLVSLYNFIFDYNNC